MHLVIAYVITLIFVLPAGIVTASSSHVAAGSPEFYGNVAGRCLFYFVLYTLIYYVGRWIRGAGTVRSYASSRLNYVAAVILILAAANTLGQSSIAGRVAP